ncbi:MAG: phosphatidylglycerophosphatase A, partial [bacterium]
MSRFFLYAFGTFGGTGFAPFAPATVASLAFTGLWILVLPVPLWLQIVLLLGVTGLGGPVATRLEQRHGKDPHLVVCDEVAGMLVTFLAIDQGIGVAGWLAGFFWFRVFDILKPPPVRSLERLPAGWGIMVDDLAA